MGVVWKAQQVKLSRMMAVKMIRGGVLAGTDEVQRFQAEAQAAANLKHPNIVSIHELGGHEGQHYYSMDFIGGKTLADECHGKPMNAREAAELLRVVCDAVALIGHFILDHVPGMLAAVAFRTVGRQRHDAHPLREPWVAVAQMEPGVVADDDMHCLSIARGELFEIERVTAEVHGGQVGKVRLSPGHLQRAVKVVSFMPGLPLHHRARALGHPDSAQVGVRVKAWLPSFLRLRGKASPKRTPLTRQGGHPSPMLISQAGKSSHSVTPPPRPGRAGLCGRVFGWRCGAARGWGGCGRAAWPARARWRGR